MKTLLKTSLVVCTRQNLAVSLVLAISLVGVSYGAGGVLTGDGLSESTAYLIEDLTDFDVFANQANYWASGVYTRLACDINLAGKPTYTIAVIAPDTPNTSEYFDGIPFEGIFDGAGNVVRNLTIDTDGAGNEYLGLFGSIEGAGAKVKNLGIENVNITGGDHYGNIGGLCGYNGSGTISNCYTSGVVIGGYNSSHVGGLCGHNSSGTINNCYSTSAVAGGENSGILGGLCGGNEFGTITNCYATGTVDGGGAFGGLCGGNEFGTITSCYATGSVTGQGDGIGGLCGNNLTNGKIENCYATGAVIGNDDLGGLCGRNNGNTITNCYAAGTVTGGVGSEDLGGLCGINSSTVNNCFWDIQTGGPDNGIATPMNTADMKTRSIFTDAEWDFTNEEINGKNDFWRMCDEGIGYPMLSGQFLAGDFACQDGVDLVDFAKLADTWGLSSGQDGYNNLCDLVDDDMIDISDLAAFAENWLCDDNTGDGSVGNPFRIKTPEQLDGMSSRSEDWGKHFILIANIDMADYLYDTAVIAPEGSSFQGVFDGNGYVIRNLTIDTDDADNDYLGLFGKIEGAGAEIKNLGIENVNVVGGDSSIYLGGLCGRNYSGNINNCYATGSVQGRSYIGGLCGYHSGGTINNCYAHGEITGRDYLGGLCGYNYGGTINSCHAAGLITGYRTFGGLCGYNLNGVSIGTITNCYAVGSLTGRNDSGHLGGLCGINLGTISNCYAVGSITGGKWSRFFGGLCGENENATISNCYATGSVIVGEDAHDLGGLCGFNENGTITNCYATGAVTSEDGSYDFGGLCGVSSITTNNCFWDFETGGYDNGIGTPKTTGEMQTESTFTGASWDFSVVPLWHMPFLAVGYPMLGWQKDIPGDFTGRYGVNMADFAILSNAWLSDDTPTANWNEECDLDGSDAIDTGDLKIFAEHWLCD